MNEMYSDSHLLQQLKFSFSALDHKEYFSAFFRMLPHPGVKIR